MSELAPFEDMSSEEARIYLRKLKTDAVFFGEKILRDFREPEKPLKLFWYQKRILRDDSDRILLNISRQTGKSSIAILESIHQAATKRNQEILIVSRSQKQSSTLLRKLTRSVFDSELKSDVTANSRTELQFRNGSIIVACPASEATIKGYSPDLVILDEAAMFADDAIFYEAIRPMLAATHGRLIVMSTPKGKRGFFWDTFNEWKEDDDAVVYNLSYKITKDAAAEFGLDKSRIGDLTCPIHTKEYYEKEKSEMPSIKFEQEYGAKFVDESDAWFPYKIFTPMMRDDILKYRGDPQKEYFLGVDWGRVADFTVVAVLERIEEGEKVYYKTVVLKEWQPQTNAEPVQQFIYDLIKRFNIEGGYSDIGGGRKQAEEFEEQGLPIEGIALSQKSKIEMFSVMRNWLEQKKLFLPDNDKLKDQLHGFTYKIGKSGRYLLHHRTSKNKGAVHDDMVDAIGLAVWATQKRRTGYGGSVSVPSVI